MRKSIPKIIHYCWFGSGKLSALSQRCIASWRRYLPDYEIKLWNEKNFDVDSVRYVGEAYRAGKFAFVSDYARFWILYHHGGVYFDTDVEIIRPLDTLLSAGPFFACETDAGDPSHPGGITCAPGLGLAAYPQMDLYGKMLALYHDLTFFNEDESCNLTTVVEYATRVLKDHGLRNTPGIQKVEEFLIYPKEYFCPIDYDTCQKIITDKTVAIHHFAGTWISRRDKLKHLVKRWIGKRPTRWIVILKQRFRPKNRRI